MEQLRGSVAIVTGAGRGFGRSVALRLAAEGVRVVAAARPLDPSISDPELMLQPEDVASAILWVLQSSKYVASLQVVLEPRG